MEERRERIQEYLISLGIRPHLRGFEILSDMIFLWMRERDILGEMPRISDLYEALQRKYKSSRPALQQLIAIAIFAMYEAIGKARVEEIFGPPSRLDARRIRTVEFVATVAHIVGVKERSEKG